MDNETTEKEFKLPYTVKLLCPLKIGDKLEPVTELVFSKPLNYSMIEHLPISGGWNYGHFKTVIARMSKQDPAFIEELQMGDLKECINVVQYFL